jgi:hypothetical protein
MPLGRIISGTSPFIASVPASRNKSGENYRGVFRIAD